MVTLTDKISKVELSHQFYASSNDSVGRYTKPELIVEDDYLLNRLRYMLRIQMPLKVMRLQNKTPYG
jgi:hypothetical protein